jgi:hypothetical protein
LRGLSPLLATQYDQQNLYSIGRSLGIKTLKPFGRRACKPGHIAGFQPRGLLTIERLFTPNLFQQLRIGIGSLTVRPEETEEITSGVERTLETDRSPLSTKQ